MDTAEPEQAPCAGGMLFYNQVVELPMSLLIIQARLQHRYYRQADALKHDALLLASNAVAFNGQGSSIARLAQRTPPSDPSLRSCPACQHTDNIKHHRTMREALSRAEHMLCATSYSQKNTTYTGCLPDCYVAITQEWQTRLLPQRRTGSRRPLEMRTPETSWTRPRPLTLRDWMLGRQPGLPAVAAVAVLGVSEP